MTNSVLRSILFFGCALSSSLSAAYQGPRKDPEVIPRAGHQQQVEEDANTCDVDPAVASIRDEFNRNGYAVLKNFFADASEDSKDNQLLSLLKDDWFDFSTKYWDRIFQELHKRGHISEPKHMMTQEYIMGKLRKPGFQEIVHRNPGRYEISLNPPDDNSPDSAKAVLYHDMPSLKPIIEKLEPIMLSILRQHPQYKEEERGKQYNLLYSMLISAPDSLHQQFHWDARHLNDEENDPDEHYPAHIINVFIPLIDVTSLDLGPTELVPQSHLETRFLRNPATRSRAKQLKPSVSPLMNVGDVLMFDFRILHRGLANTSIRNINRPYLVLAFSIPSFHDTANWPGPSIFD